MRSHEDLILQKIFAQFLRRILWRFLQVKILSRFGCKLFLLKTFKRSALYYKIFKQFLPKIFSRSLVDLHFIYSGLYFNFFFVFNFFKWSNMLRRSSEELLINLQKIFLRSHEELRKIFIEDLLKISKRTLNEIFLTSRRRWASYLRRE